MGIQTVKQEGGRKQCPFWGDSRIWSPSIHTRPRASVYVGQVHDHTFIAWKHEMLLLVGCHGEQGEVEEIASSRNLKPRAGEKRHRCVRFNNRRLKQWVITASRECGKKWLSVVWFLVLMKVLCPNWSLWSERCGQVFPGAASKPSE